MTTPVWQAGTAYNPGALVQPASVAPRTPVALVNADFETGDLTGWDVTREGGTGGTYSIASDRPYQGTRGAKWLGAGGGSTGGGTASVWRNTAHGPVSPGQSLTVSAYIAQDDTGSSQNYGRARIYWYDASDVQIGAPVDGNVIAGNFNDYRLSTATGTAPANAAYARAALWLSANGSGGMRADYVTWNHAPPAFDSGLIYKAVQPATGTSAATEPAWPGVLGVTVVDGGVTWEAVNTSRVVWQASPLFKSGATEPAWPTTPGAFVSDGTISWECVSRVIEDAKCPHGKVVAIAASKVYCADGDIVRFSATANPLDWSTANDAGYLPTGLQQSNANDMAVLGLYRSNLAALNPSCFQMWQVDPDPAQMALMDQMEGVGSSWQKAAQSVGNDLFYLSQLGVRSIGIAGASTNLQAGDVGMPVDALLQTAIRDASASGVSPVATYYPSAGQYWLTFRPPGPLGVGGAFPTLVTGESFTGAYVARGGYHPYTFAITAGALPPGVTLDTDGHYAGACTTAGAYAWTVSVTDRDGSVVTLNDAAVIPDPGFDPNLQASRYLLIPIGDFTDRSAVSYDDSAWATGLLPLGTADRPDAAAAGFPEMIATNWPLDKNAWFRATFLITVPDDMRLSVYLDDAAHVWINGVSVLNHTTNDLGGTNYLWTADLPASAFVAGTNHIAIYCRGDIYAVNNYVSFRLQPL